MVRFLVGTMIEVARGRFSLNEFELFVKNNGVKLPIVCAPSNGLFLDNVKF